MFWKAKTNLKNPLFVQKKENQNPEKPLLKSPIKDSEYQENNSQDYPFSPSTRIKSSRIKRKMEALRKKIELSKKRKTRKCKRK